MVVDAFAPFYRAVTAVVDGRVDALRECLDANPELVAALGRPPHRATLLHYVAANGVEDALQRTPDQAVEVCQLLLDRGAVADALADCDGGGRNQTPLCLLVSSYHPFARGLQPQLIHTLVDGGAQVDGLDGDGMPLMTALVFGYTAAARALADCGAKVGSLYAAAGLGNLEQVRDCLDRSVFGPFVSPLGAAPPGDRTQAIQQALHFAVTHGHGEVANLLLDCGADANGRVAGHHCELPLLQAMFVREASMARLLVERGADLDLRDGKRGVSARQFGK